MPVKGVWSEILRLVGISCGEGADVMILLAKKRSLSAAIVCNPGIMGGVPTIRDMRIPVEMILVHRWAGYSRRNIVNPYPTPPLDGIEAAAAWAEQTTGPNRRKHPNAGLTDPILIDACLQAGIGGPGARPGGHASVANVVRAGDGPPATPCGA
jgi:uncharacterized protein (DUF433 family)